MHRRPGAFYLPCDTTQWSMSQMPKRSESSRVAVPISQMQRHSSLGPTIAGLLLAAFCFQCFWLMSHLPLSETESSFINGETTTADHTGRSPAFTSPLVTAVANAPLHFLPHNADLKLWEWLFRFPFAVTGVALGASLWYVASRQFGETAGYISLALYCFCPVLIARFSSVSPDALTAWGGFGTVYTGLAVAHTLYAQRSGVLWNRKRILLLGIAFGIAVAAQLSAVIFLPITLAYMLYLVPERQGATIQIISLASAAAVILLSAAYGFHFKTLAQAAIQVHPLHLSAALLNPGSWKMMGLFLLSSSLGFAILFGIALFALAVWPKTRFFGTVAPLLTAVILMLTGFLLPHAGGFSFCVTALPFLILFTAGIFADLLQGRHRPLFIGILWAVLLSQTVDCLIILFRARS
jgi:hypothetical protein